MFPDNEVEIVSRRKTSIKITPAKKSNLSLMVIRILGQQNYWFVKVIKNSLNVDKKCRLFLENKIVKILIDVLKTFIIFNIKLGGILVLK